MNIILCTWASMVLLIALFYFSEIIFEKYVSEKNPFKKWWRKNIVDGDHDEK